MAGHSLTGSLCRTARFAGRGLRCGTAEGAPAPDGAADWQRPTPSQDPTHQRDPPSPLAGHARVAPSVNAA